MSLIQASSESVLGASGLKMEHGLAPSRRTLAASDGESWLGEFGQAFAAKGSRYPSHHLPSIGLLDPLASNARVTPLETSAIPIIC